MRHFGLTAIARNANANYSQVTTTTITKYRMHWVEKLFLRIAAWCVVHAMQIRQRRQTSLVSLKQKETTAKHGELENRLVLLARVIQNGKRKYLVKS